MDIPRSFMKNVRDRTRNGGSPTKVVEEYLAVERKRLLLNTLLVGRTLLGCEPNILEITCPQNRPR